MAMPGMPEMLLILGVMVLLFGGKKLPEIGSALGESIKNFKKGVAPESEGKAKDDDRQEPK